MIGASGDLAEGYASGHRDGGRDWLVVVGATIAELALCIIAPAVGLGVGAEGTGVIATSGDLGKLYWLDKPLTSDDYTSATCYGTRRRADGGDVGIGLGSVGGMFG